MRWREGWGGGERDGEEERGGEEEGGARVELRNWNGCKQGVA